MIRNAPAPSTNPPPIPLADLVLKGKTISRAWARAVRRRQRASLRDLKSIRPPSDCDHESDPPKALPKPAGAIPTCISDLIRPEMLTGRMSRFSSRYQGVAFIRYRQEWRAFMPGTGGRQSGAIGFFASEEMAAEAVLKAVQAKAGVMA